MSPLFEADYSTTATPHCLSSPTSGRVGGCSSHGITATNTGVQASRDPAGCPLGPYTEVGWLDHMAILLLIL